MTLPDTLIDLAYKPRRWQIECHTQRRRFTVLALHRRAGKSEWAIMQLIDSAMRCKDELGLYAYVAPFLKQAKIIAWARLKQRLSPLLAAGMAVVSEAELTITFPHNGAAIRILGADNPDAIRGIRLDGVVVDEVAQIKPQVWEDVIQPTLSDRMGWAVFIGTPKGVNLFSELFYRAKSYPDWHSALYTVHDTQAINPLEVARLERDMNPASFAREYLCDFHAAGDDQLISLADVEEATKRQYKREDIHLSPRILGVDVARFGDDRSVIFPRQGLVAEQPLVFRGMNNMDLAARIVDKIETYQPDAVFIDVGNGTGVIDRVRQLGHTVIEVNFGGKSADDAYNNKRTEMWSKLAQWLRDGGAIPNITDLKQDMGAPTYFYNAANKICLESKDDIKRRGLPSPDLGDALALTFAHPVVKKKDPQIYGLHNFQRTPYNPYDSNRLR